MRNPIFFAVCGLLVLLVGCGVAVTGVQLDKDSAFLAVGSTQQLTATVEPADATHPSVQWSSSDEGVATVDADGLVTGVATGRATITVTARGGTLSDTCEVAAGASIGGSFLYDGQPFLSSVEPGSVGGWNLDAEDPANSDRNVWIEGSDLLLVYDSATGGYTLGGLPEAGMSLWFHFLYTPPSWQLGGNYIAEHWVVDLPAMTEDQRNSTDCVLYHVVHLTEPHDNGVQGGVIPDSYLDLPTHGSPVQIAWDDVPEAGSYHVSISRYRSTDHPDGWGFIEYTIDVDVSVASYTATLAPNDDFEYYALSIGAYSGTTGQLGYYMQLYENGYGWDYRFRI